MLTVQVANEKEPEADIGNVDKVYFELSPSLFLVKDDLF